MSAGSFNVRSINLALEWVSGDLYDVVVPRPPLLSILRTQLCSCCYD